MNEYRNDYDEVILSAAQGRSTVPLVIVGLAVDGLRHQP